MPHYGTLQEFTFGKDVDDIRGTAVYGVDDDKLGKIEDLIFDHSSGEIKYAVVDTGGWFSHKKFLVPANRIHAYDKDDKEAFQVDLVKDQIQRKFPRYDEKMLKSDEDWNTYEREYRRAWDVDPVQHRDDRVDLDVTPATVEPSVTASGPGIPMGSLGEQVAEPNPNFDRDQEALDRVSSPQRLAGKFPETIQSSDKLQMAPAHVPGRANDQARVGSERVPDRAWQDNPTGSSGHQNRVGPNLNNEFPIDEAPPRNPDQYKAADVGTWHPRMKRFEEVLKKNRVDVTASCPSCRPAKDTKSAA